eukprot:12917033-Prorocentrum_lima.AAC.1
MPKATATHLASALEQGPAPKETAYMRSSILLRTAGNKQQTATSSTGKHRQESGSRGLREKVGRTRRTVSLFGGKSSGTSA